MENPAPYAQCENVQYNFQDLPVYSLGSDFVNYGTLYFSINKWYDYAPSYATGISGTNENGIFLGTVYGYCSIDRTNLLYQPQGGSQSWTTVSYYLGASPLTMTVNEFSFSSYGGSSTCSSYTYGTLTGIMESYGWFNFDDLNNQIVISTSDASHVGTYFLTNVIAGVSYGTIAYNKYEVIILDNHPPTLDSSPVSQQATVGISSSYLLPTYTDLDGDPVSFVNPHEDTFSTLPSFVIFS